MGYPTGSGGYFPPTPRIDYNVDFDPFICPHCGSEDTNAWEMTDYLGLQTQGEFCHCLECDTTWAIPAKKRR